MNNNEVRERTKDSPEIISGESPKEYSIVKQPVCRPYKKWVEYKKILYDPMDTLPYNNCYIIIEKDSLFYYKEGKLEEVRTMVREEHSDHAFTFKEDADDHILFSLDFNSFKLSRDNYDGLDEYFILDEIYYQNKQKGN